MPEKRKAPRVQPFVVPCRVIDGPRRFSAYLTDLSLEGAQVSAGVAAPTPGTTVVLEVRLGRQVAPPRLSAEVVWTRGAGGLRHAFGVTFKGLRPDARRVLEAALEEFRRRAAMLA